VIRCRSVDKTKMNLKEARFLVYNFLQAINTLLDDLKNEISEERWNIWYVFSTLLDIQDLINKLVQRIRRLKLK
jgi:hypothetical protein